MNSPRCSENGPATRMTLGTMENMKAMKDKWSDSGWMSDAHPVMVAILGF